MHISMVMSVPPETAILDGGRSDALGLSQDNFKVMLERTLKEGGSHDQASTISVATEAADDQAEFLSNLCGSTGNESGITPVGASNCPIRPKCFPTGSSNQTLLAGNTSLWQLDALESWQQGINTLLDEVEQIQFSLDLGEKGRVEFVGGKMENGEFQFTFGGNRDAIGSFLGTLARVLMGFGQFNPADGNGCASQSGLPGFGQFNPADGNGCPSQSGLPGALIGTELASQGGVEPVSLTVIDDTAVFSIGLDQDQEDHLMGLGDDPLENGIEPDLVERQAQEFKHIVSSTDEGVSEDQLVTQVEATGYQLVTQVEATGYQVVAPQETRSPAEVFDQSRTGYSTRIEGGVGGDFTEKDQGNDLFKDIPTAVSGLVRSGEGVVREFVFQVPAGHQAEEISELFDRVLDEFSRKTGTKEVVIKMEPENLGSITVRLTEEGNRVSCTWQITDPRTRDLIEQQLPLLEARLNEQGMTFANYMGEDRSGWFDRDWFFSVFKDSHRETAGSSAGKLQPWLVDEHSRVDLVV